MNPFKRGRIGLEGAPRAQKPEPRASDGVATIRLYDAIDSWGGDWGVSAREFGAALDALPDDVGEIRLLINSPGGEIWDGLAILNQLRSHRARVVAVVEGIAASAASFIAAGVDECVMARNSEMFIHNAMGIAMGDADIMRDVAADLERHDSNLASIYARKSGKEPEFWLAEMKRDRFLTADEAVELGLADRIEGEGDAASARARFDLSVFTARAGSGRHAAAADSTLPVSTEPGFANRKELPVSDLKDGLRDRLGVTDAEIADDELLAALDARLAADGAAGSTEQEPAAAGAALPEGVVPVDGAVLAQLQADAAAGRAAREQQTAERRDSIVERALAEGRITRPSKAQYRALLDRDEEGTLALLESLAPNTVVPVAEVGYADGTAPDDDAYPAHWKR